MPHATSNGPQSVSATLSYFTPPADGSKPFNKRVVDTSTGEHKRNWVEKEHQMEIENIRGHEGDYTLDTSGFQYFRHAATHTTFESDEAVEREYYPESIELIKELTGASRVVLFDHTIRRRRPGQVDDSPDKRQPVPLVHVDQTPNSAEARVHRHLPAADAPALLTKRYQILNLWRPIRHIALDHPLALCDYNSTSRLGASEGKLTTEGSDFVPSDLIYPDREGKTFKGETFAVKFNAGHRWKYLRGMEPDELVLIKCFDSASAHDTSIAVLTPHTAFDDPSTPADAPLRESIELRALVFYD